MAKEIEKHVKYYSTKEMSTDEMMEDYFAEEEKAGIQEILDKGGEIVGVIDKDTTDEERDAILEKLCDLSE